MGIRHAGAALADTGPIGGDLSHEFIILAETGGAEEITLTVSQIAAQRLARQHILPEQGRREQGRQRPRSAR
ncbi:MAG: hypothetical protein HC788_14655 [Sphingopyxis sp.]|nr:hypothetical protein [Sphingopyxis sp.]